MSVKTSWLPYRLLSWLIIAFAYAARRSEGSERARILSAKSRGNFLSEFILAYTAPGERFSFLAIRPTLTLDAMSSIELLPRVSKGAPPGVDPPSRNSPIKGPIQSQEARCRKLVSQRACDIYSQLSSKYELT
jgi:hypothetical protein